MTDATNTIEVTNDDGRTFTVRVRVVKQGDYCGFLTIGGKRCQFYPQSGTLVEFFDKAHHAGSDRPLGWVGSGSYLSSLETGWSHVEEDWPHGICLKKRGAHLNTGDDVWRVSAKNIHEAIAFAHTFDQEGA